MQQLVLLYKGSSLWLTGLIHSFWTDHGHSERPLPTLLLTPPSEWTRYSVLSCLTKRLLAHNLQIVTMLKHICIAPRDTWSPLGPVHDTLNGDSLSQADNFDFRLQVLARMGALATRPTHSTYGAANRAIAGT